MLSSIHPLGERSRNNRWTTTATAHLLGSTVGGAALGAVCGALGTLIAAAVGSLALLVALIALAVVGATIDLCVALGTSRVGLPTIRRQVDERWIDEYRGWVYGAGFGLQLGMAFVTIVTSAVVYLLIPLAMATASPVGGLLVGAAFGLSRGAMVFTMAGVHQPNQLAARHRRFARLASPATWAAVVAQAGVAVGAMAMIFTGTGIR